MLYKLIIQGNFIYTHYPEYAQVQMGFRLFMSAYGCVNYIEVNTIKDNLYTSEIVENVKCVFVELSEDNNRLHRRH